MSLFSNNPPLSELISLIFEPEQLIHYKNLYLHESYGAPIHSFLIVGNKCQTQFF